jgi:hypothetical protein
VIILLTLAYVAIGALLLSLNLASKWSVWLKAASIVVVSVFYFASYHGLRSLSGLPSGEDLPPDFRLLYVSIDEPDKASGGEGAIYIWLRTLQKDQQLASGEPRAYRLAYSESLAENVEAALKQLEQGKRLNGKRSRQQIAEQEITEEQEGVAITGEAGSEASVGNEFSIVFSEVPPPDLPPKPAL